MNAEEKIDEQKRRIVHAVVRVAVGAQAFSAVEQLLKRESDPSVQAQLKLEADYAEYVRLISPAWAWSRIRPLHQMLTKETG